MKLIRHTASIEESLKEILHFNNVYEIINHINTTVYGGDKVICNVTFEPIEQYLQKTELHKYKVYAHYLIDNNSYVYGYSDSNFENTLEESEEWFKFLFQNTYELYTQKFTEVFALKLQIEKLNKRISELEQMNKCR